MVSLEFSITFIMNYHPYQKYIHACRITLRISYYNLFILELSECMTDLHFALQSPFIILSNFVHLLDILDILVLFSIKYNMYAQHSVSPPPFFFQSYYGYLPSKNIFYYVFLAGHSCMVKFRLTYTGVLISLHNILRAKKMVINLNLN